MADMALGLTKRAVEGTVTRVLAAIEEDTKLKAAAQQDLRFIVDEFQMMQSFLEMANDNKVRTSNKVVKTFVRQLRELAFDVENCVEFVIHLDTTSAGARKSWLWRVVRLPSCMTPAWVGDLDQAVAQLKQLKARVEELSQRNTRYNILGGDDSGSSNTPPLVPSEPLDEATAFPSTVDILRDLWKVNGKQSSSIRCNLKYLITDGQSNELRVISVWRSAGVDHEAARILDAAYHDIEMCKEFKARARVKLMHPFNIQEFLKCLLNQLYVTSLQLDTRSTDLLGTNGDSQLRQLLSKHRYLIFLEDLSTMVEWDLIRSFLPDHQNGSRIVISTEDLGIAFSCTREPYRVLLLAQFPNDQYIYAFYKPSCIDMTELVKQLGQRRVISLWGDKGGDTASLVRDVYEAMEKKTGNFRGVEFEEFMWVNVPSLFSLEDLSWPMQCAGHYHPDYQRAHCCWSKKACETRILCVIEGLQSKEDWDSLKDAGLVPEHTKSCVVVIANQEAVAQRCEDTEEREGAINNAAIIGTLFAEKEKYYSWGHDNSFGRSHGWSGRIEKALFQFAPFITHHSLSLQLIFYCMSKYCVNAVWGASGVGKSALFRFVYCSTMAHSLEMFQLQKLPLFRGYIFHILLPEFERFGWVDVSDGPFDLAELSHRLLLDLNSYDPGEMEKSAVGIIQGHNSIQRCCEIMRNHKCLVVIDGLRSTRDWYSIKQAFVCHLHPESCIFVIATDESIAQHCVTRDNHKGVRSTLIRPLDDTSALDLFQKIVFEDQKTLNSDLAASEKKDKEWTTAQKLMHANRIVPKCGGLPKIIDAVAKSNRSFWENINDDLVTKLKNDPQFHHLSGVLSWMHSYFDGCSDSVKPCVFYLSVFPTNYKIRKAHLRRRWSAEGYSRDTIAISAKENAERLFDELVKLGIIHELQSMPLCQISGFFREYIISQQMEDNLVFALEGNCKLNSQRTVQHLTIMKSWDREQENVFKSIDVSRLRSLTVYGKWESFFISDDKMKCIRVLDLEGTTGLKDCDLELIFGNLLSLKFICLRGCKSIKCLPKTLGGLRQLESLDVRGTSIVTLPHDIINLQKIQFIRAGLFLSFEDWTSATSEVSDDAVGSQPSRTAPTPEAEGSDAGLAATSPAQASISEDKQVDGSQKKLPGCCWTSRVSGRMFHNPRLPGCPFSATARRFTHNNIMNSNIINGGVDVPEGIENMLALHTLGTVNMSARGKEFLKKLKDKKKLRQLLKLSVCGINKENWKDLCDALSSHPHLESLSLVLEEDLTEDMHFDKPPKALKCLRLYGHIHRLPAWTWIKDPRQVVNKLEKFDLEVIISSQEDMSRLVESLPRGGILRRLCIKPTHQVTSLRLMGQEAEEYYKIEAEDFVGLEVLKINCSCSSSLEVAFRGGQRIARFIRVLIIHCYEGSDFKIYSNIDSNHPENGLDGLLFLNTVWLKGYDENADYVAHLKELVAKHEQKPVFKFEKLESA